MSGLRYDRILAGTALALVLALPGGGAFALPEASPAVQAEAVPTDPPKPQVPPNATRDQGSENPSAAPSAPAPTAAPAVQDATPPQTATAPAAVVDPLASLDPADRPIAEKMRDLLAAKTDKIFANKKERSAVEAFYQSRSLAPVWIEKGVEARRTAAAVKYLQSVDADGLDPSDYRTPDFKAAADAAALAEAELKMTATVLAFARHAENGRVHFSRVSADIFYNLEPTEPADVLGKIVAAPDVAAALDSFNPQQPGYKALKAKLAALRGKTTEEVEVVRVPEGPILRLGMDDLRVAVLRKRLNIAGDQNDTKYDASVQAAVKEFQKGAGLGVDGNVGPGTLRALNGVPKQTNRIDTILANMERWRWLPRDLGNTYVMLNIPDYTLKVMRDGAIVWKTKVVVGKQTTPTPILSETMKFITVNPTWNVPPSIVYGEYLPAVQQDPTVLSRMGLKVVQNRDGSVHIYQPPGDANALGRLRFNFPNKFLVYQHDTPDKHLFKHDKRAYSHGCMRVEDPLKYAEVLLSLVNPNDGYSVERLRRMYGPSEQNINLATPIPVHITYQTAFVDEAGELQIREDIYGRDARLLAALKGEDRRVADLPIERSQPNYSRPSVRLPAGVALEGSGTSSGPSFFERLFGSNAPDPRPQASRKRTVVR